MERRIPEEQFFVAPKTVVFGHPIDPVLVTILAIHKSMGPFETEPGHVMGKPGWFPVAHSMTIVTEPPHLIEMRVGMTLLTVTGQAGKIASPFGVTIHTDELSMGLCQGEPGRFMGHRFGFPRGGVVTIYAKLAKSATMFVIFPVTIKAAFVERFPAQFFSHYMTAVTFCGRMLTSEGERGVEPMVEFGTHIFPLVDGVAVDAFPRLEYPFMGITVTRGCIAAVGLNRSIEGLREPFRMVGGSLHFRRLMAFGAVDLGMFSMEFIARSIMIESDRLPSPLVMA
jgi:hypothetical protein